MKSLILISNFGMMTLALLCASCSVYKKMPGQYVVYDTTSPSAPKSYVEFYTYKQIPSNRLAATFSETLASRVKIVTANKEDYIGTIGIDGCERLRIVLPPGEHRFHVGPGINDADLKFVTQKDKVIPVEANSSTNNTAQVVAGFIGMLATTRCDAKVDPMRPCNSNDRNWVPLKR